MNPVLERIYRTGKVEDADGNVFDCSKSAVRLETGLLLYELVRTVQPKRTLEVGLAYGASALFICQGHQDNGAGFHTAIDPHQFQRYRSVGLLNVQRAGFQDVFRLIQEPSFHALHQLYERGERFDFAFIDGAHFFDSVVVDFFYIDMLLQIGGCLAFDDLWMHGVRKAASFVLRNRSYELLPVPTSCRAPIWKRQVMAGRRILQDPLGVDIVLKLRPSNVAVMRKYGEDTRPWGLHRAF